MRPESSDLYPRRRESRPFHTEVVGYKQERSSCTGLPLLSPRATGREELRHFNIVVITWFSITQLVDQCTSCILIGYATCGPIVIVIE